MLSQVSATLIIGGLSIAVCATFEYLLNKRHSDRAEAARRRRTSSASVGANVNAYDDKPRRAWPPKFSDN